MTTCYSEIVHEGSIVDMANFIIILFLEVATTTQPSATAILISQQPSTLRQDSPPAKNTMTC